MEQGKRVTAQKMKMICRNCHALHWDESRGEYLCWGCMEPFVIEDVYHECYNQYTLNNPNADPQPLDFIGKFNKAEPVGEAFVNGKCYWFAKILEQRFKDYDPDIMYNPVTGHFTTRIKGKFYDINGDVTTENENQSFMWDRLDDPDWKNRITRDCIDYEL